jgi:hypothetical protein
MLRRWVDAFAGFKSAMRASGLFGRSIKLRRLGRNAEALQAARAGLLELQKPCVNRRWPPAASTQISLTIQVEQLAQLLGEPGAAWRDVVEVAESLRRLPDEPEGKAAEVKRAWLPYFEARVGGPAPGPLH